MAAAAAASAVQGLLRLRREMTRAPPEARRLVMSERVESKSSRPSLGGWGWLAAASHYRSQPPSEHLLLLTLPNHHHHHRTPMASEEGRLPPPSHSAQPVLSPEVFAEEPPAFEKSFAGAGAAHQPPSFGSVATSSLAPKAQESPLRRSVSVREASSSSQHGRNPSMRSQSRNSGHWGGNRGRRASNARSSLAAGSGQRADGIGGMGRGTAATGDLGAWDDFEGIDDVREQVADLEADYNARHSQAGDEPLSGRIIHVSHYIPFVIRALAEVDYERRKEEQISATASVAAMAAAARARKAARQAEMEARAKEAAAEQVRREAADAQNKGEDQHSAKASPNRRPSIVPGGNAFTLFDGADIERRLAENQARSKMRGGRRAWMMTPVVDDDDNDNDDAVSEKDAYTPVGSRRPSRLSFSSRFSFSSMDGGADSPRAAIRYGNAGVSDFEPSPAATPPLPQQATPPQWVLAPRRGHTALNSGIRSLCKTHKQTFIGWPGDIHFAAQARKDERKEASETTKEERREIEEVLGSLDDPKNWRDQDAPVLGADPSMSADGAPPVRQVPGPLMNGADPMGTDESAPAHGIKYVPVWLDYDVAHGHYEGYCKTTLWPLFHYLLWQDVPGDRKGWEDYSWEAYWAANSAFAEKIAAEYQPGDIVWIHDYHLLLVPAMLRALVPNAHIGLFVHAPFPSSEIFRCLPKRREIIEGMLGADLACFQAFSYSRHFLSSCIRVCGYEASATSIETSNGHVTHISYNPIGIDATKIAKDAESPEVMPKIKAIRDLYKDKKIIIGRDKLDVVRGVVQKLQAFQKFLEEWPEWRDKVVLIQITAPSMTDSPMLERQVSELVSNINGQFGNLNHTPCIHYHQQLLREEYFALLNIADMALITSVRDGMNTTSMEFVLANGSQAPLILSEFTGTAGRMRQALQVNPWNTYGVAKAIDYGLRLSGDERKFRHDELHRQIVGHTSHHWAIHLVKLILLRLFSDTTAHFTPALDRQLLKQRFDSASKRLILLDYDGTCTPIVKDPEAALPSQRLLDAMEALSSDPRNIIYLVSGRDEKFLTKIFGHLTGLGFSAEHGGYIKEPGTTHWVNMTASLDMSWMPDIRKVFEYYTERTSGSWIEQKKSSITWHYRNADPDYGAFQAKECQAHMDNFAAQEKFAVEVVVGKKNLEVRPLAVNKGEIVKRIVYNHPDASFVFCAGDDRTDEDMMKFFSSLTPIDSELLSASSHQQHHHHHHHQQQSQGGDVASASAQGQPTMKEACRDSSAAPSKPSSAAPQVRVTPSRRASSYEPSGEDQENVPLLMTAPTPLHSGTATPVKGQPGANRSPSHLQREISSSEDFAAEAEQEGDEEDGDDEGDDSFEEQDDEPRELALTRSGIFTTAVGAKGRKTVAKWHLDGPYNVVDVLALMAGMGGEAISNVAGAGASAEEDDGEGEEGAKEGGEKENGKGKEEE